MLDRLKFWRAARPGAEAEPTSPFSALPVRSITVGTAAEQLAVHVAGQFTLGRTPLICVPGYNRNMADFSGMLPLLRRALDRDWPIVLVDLRGRGRSSKRGNANDYTTTNDARDLSTLARALGIETATILGQGHGGQVAMALALERPGLIAATILLDAGPIITARSLVRMRSNVDAIDGLRGVAGLTLMLRRMTSADYPGIEPAELDVLAARIHRIEARGRAAPLFDPRLIERLRGFAHDDVLAAQWPLFDLLKPKPLMLMRTELTDQLTLDVFAAMQERRPDAAVVTVPGEGSPSLLNRFEVIEAIAEFCRSAGQPAGRRA